MKNLISFTKALFSKKARTFRQVKRPTKQTNHRHWFHCFCVLLFLLFVVGCEQAKIQIVSDDDNDNQTEEPVDPRSPEDKIIPFFFVVSSSIAKDAKEVPLQPQLILKFSQKITKVSNINQFFSIKGRDNIERKGCWAYHITKKELTLIWNQASGCAPLLNDHRYTLNIDKELMSDRWSNLIKGFRLQFTTTSDGTPPAGLTVSVDNYTRDSAITINVRVDDPSDVAGIYFSESSSKPMLTQAGWEAYTTTKNWTLSTALVHGNTGSFICVGQRCQRQYFAKSCRYSHCR